MSCERVFLTNGTLDLTFIAMPFVCYVQINSPDIRDETELYIKLFECLHDFLLGGGLSPTIMGQEKGCFIETSQKINNFYSSESSGIKI